MLSSPACFGGAKKGKYQKWGDDRHMEVGQDRELYPNLPLIGEALHCSTPPTPKRSNQKKRNTQTEGKKKWFGEGCKTQNDGQTTGGGYIAYHVPLFPLFPARPLPLDRNIFFIWIFSLGAKRNWVLWPVLGYCVHSTPPG
jgi:hypothetical protein